MTSFNGNEITYDNVGNPLTYAGYTYTWEEGRQLAGISGNGKTISYSYNDQGIRQSKTVNGVTTNYRLVGDRVSWEGNGTDSIYYTYDGSGNLISMNLNGNEYFYTRNLQGDITGLIDSTGTQVVSYSYDSWGSVLSTTGSLADTLGQKNPYKYRGYRLDSETGMYYLNSRYYMSEWGRFLSPDVLISYGAPGPTSNVFSYCNNNTINMSDSSGFIPVETGFDIACLGLSVSTYLANPSFGNFLYVAWDATAACVPYLPGSYVWKAGGLIDELVKQGANQGKFQNVVVLGKTMENGVSYIDVAKGKKATYLFFNDDYWVRLNRCLGKPVMLEINRRFLQSQIDNGAKILLSHNPIFPAPIGFYGFEISMLISNGYHFYQNGKIWGATK